MKLRLLILSLLVITLTGCEVPVPDSSVTKLVIGVWGGREGQQVVEIANLYSINNNIPISVEVVNEDAYHDQLSAMILSNSSRWDIALAKSEWIGPWIDYQGVRPIGIDNSFVKNEGKEEEKIYSLQVTRDVPVLWYRKDIFTRENISPPGTWEELFTVAKELTIPPDFYGLGMASTPYSMGQNYFQLFLGFGGIIDPERKEISFISDQGISAMDYYTQLSHEGIIPPVSEEGPDPVTLLQNNQAAMAILWTSQAQVLFDCGKSPALCFNGESSIAGVEIPVIDTNIQARYLRRSTGLILPVGSDSYQDADNFMTWLASYDGQALLNETDASGSPISSYVDCYYENGIDLVAFRFTDNFFDKLNQTIYNTVNGQISSPDAMLVLAASLRDDLNRTDRRP